MLQGDSDKATDLHDQEVLMAQWSKPQRSDLRKKGRDRMTVTNCVPGLGIKRASHLGVTLRPGEKQSLLESRFSSTPTGASRESLCLARVCSQHSLHPGCSSF